MKATPLFISDKPHVASSINLICVVDLKPLHVLHYHTLVPPLAHKSSYTRMCVRKATDTRIYKKKIINNLTERKDFLGWCTKVLITESIAEQVEEP